MVDVLTEFGPRARAATWRLDVKRVGERGSAQEWAIDDEERLSAVKKLYRLALNPAQEFAAPAPRGAAQGPDPPPTQGSLDIAHIDHGATPPRLIGPRT